MGATASGKTQLAIHLAKQYSCEVVSFDSRQFYKELGIAVAKPSSAELKEVPHHFINHKSIFDDYNIFHYAIDCRNKINQLFTSQKYIILVGGSGLYLNAVLNGLDPLPPKNINLRDRLQKNFQDKGIDYLQNELIKLNPKKMKKIDSFNPQRLIRAIEIELGGETTQKLPSFEKPFELEKIAIQWERETLYNRINNRVDKMVEMGLLKEAQKLFPYKENNALKTVGYAELFDYMSGQVTLEIAVNKIKQHSRNYAKRQLTWFNRDSKIRWMQNEQILNL